MKRKTTEEDVKKLVEKLGWKPGKTKPNSNGSTYQVFTKSKKKIWIGNFYIEHEDSGIAFPYPYEEISDVENFINTGKAPD